MRRENGLWLPAEVISIAHTGIEVVFDNSAEYADVSKIA